ncbi:hypothetical protein HJC23_005288 [Cyclotella cryptica]|uniref:Uncharacterized protein n=1 Tax=Cyclotella cryptica TaxID=29204 RepID=A0ABD3P2Q5_9STRA|eukprot:CCRYP_017730-RA/>CCRYP_017730-RA protein AED:0.00 eAED:0.00 QI:201/-1/1/1/-1/1/1/325/507
MKSSRAAIHCALSILTSTVPTSSFQVALREAPASRSIELFPSDDSDYECADRSDTYHGDGIVTSLAGGEYHPTQSSLEIGPLRIVDPVDVVADWVASAVAEYSLQRNSPDGGPDDADREYILETYSPGSALDVFAQVSHPYTPLSYQMRTIVRVFLPSLVFASIGIWLYPSMAQFLVHLPSSLTTNDAPGGNFATNNVLYTDEVLTVLSNDLSQYVQNILTTCALLFGMLVGQTYYFMYQQQEHVFFALFAEVTEAKSLLEQISLMTYGRPSLYLSLLSRMNDYVQKDLKQLSIREPTAATSRLPKDDPLESILYATSVGVPGVVYETVKSLRQARATRCGALQRKLPNIHIFLLRLLGVIVLTSFPVCGSGSQAIAPNILLVQSYMFGILVFGLTVVINVVEELRNSRKRGAYNVDGVLEVMVGGLEKELQERLDGKIWTGVSPSAPGRGRSYDASNDWDDAFMAFESDKVLSLNAPSHDTGSDAPPISRGKRIKYWLQGRVLRKK